MLNCYDEIVKGKSPKDYMLTIERINNRGPSESYAPTEEEYERFLDAAKGRKDRVIFYTLGESGIRATEFAHIKLHWLQGGNLIIPPIDMDFRPKTPAGARSIPLRKMSRIAWDTLHDWLIDNDGKMNITRVTAWYRVKAGGERAGLRRRLFPHALRAFCATRWAYRLGGTPYVLMQLMGWEDLDIALRYIKRSGVQVHRAMDEYLVQRLNG